MFSLLHLLLLASLSGSSLYLLDLTAGPGGRDLGLASLGLAALHQQRLDTLAVHQGHHYSSKCRTQVP